MEFDPLKLPLPRVLEDEVPISGGGTQGESEDSHGEWSDRSVGKRG